MRNQVMLPLVLGLLGSCAHVEWRPSAQQRAERTGCYRVSLGTWEPAIELGRDAEYLVPPAAIELTNHPESPFGGLATPLAGAPPTMQTVGMWGLQQDGTVAMNWSTGLVGFTMKLKLESNDLRGEAESYWDSGRESQAAQVFMKRVPCPGRTP
jgi:hypothetical protein